MEPEDKFPRKGEVMAKAKKKKRIAVDLQGEDLERFEAFQDSERAAHNANGDAAVARKLILLSLDRKLRHRATG